MDDFATHGRVDDLMSSWVIEDFNEAATESGVESPKMTQSDMRLLLDAQRESGGRTPLSSRASSTVGATPDQKHSPPCRSPTTEAATADLRTAVSSRLESDVMWNWAASRPEIRPPSDHMAKCVRQRDGDVTSCASSVDGDDDPMTSSAWKKLKAFVLSSSFISCALLVGTLVVFYYKRREVQDVFRLMY